MKIDKTTNPLPGAQTGEVATRPATGRPAGELPSGTGKSETSVHLGSTSAKLRSLESAAASTPLMDANKIAEIKQAISEGRFQVNSGVVADRLISTVRDLINASNR